MSGSAPLSAAIGRLVEDVPDGALRALVARLRDGTPRERLRRAVAAPNFEARVGGLLAAWPEGGDIDGQAVALAIECAAERQRHAERERISVVWTGPASEMVPVRLTEQALKEIINGAGERLIIASFAIYRVGWLRDVLIEAADRGVRVALIVEPRTDPSDAAARLLGVRLAEAAPIYVWADDHRLRTPAGTGVIHAKCAVADGRKLLVSSANLTEFALSINMEMGLLVKGGPVPAKVQAHFEALISSGELSPL